jgi:D-alanine-D-alanine ligase
MRVCLLTTQDLHADPFPKDDWPCDPRPFLPEATWHVATLKKSTSVEDVTRLIEEDSISFFNLCDGAADQDIPGIGSYRLWRSMVALPEPLRSSTSPPAR